MAKAGRGKTRRDPKRRVLRPGESIRVDGKYQYKYHIDGKPHFVYSWKLEPTDQLPKGKKPCLSLRELEKQIETQVAVLTNMPDGTMTVCELVDRYLQTKTGVRQSTRQGYITVQRILEKQSFGKMKSARLRHRMQSYFSSSCRRKMAGAIVPSIPYEVYSDRLFRWLLTMIFL